MTDFFAALYEWFGLIPLYSSDLADHLRGWDLLCESYSGTPGYVYVGWLMILVTMALYAFQYHVFDRPNFQRRHHWWLVACVIAILNFTIAFAIIETFSTGINRLSIRFITLIWYIRHVDSAFSPSLSPG